MDGAEGAASAPLSAWASVRSFFTPATLFLFVNLVIGTIALTSRSHHRRRRAYHDDPHHQEPFSQPQDGYVDGYYAPPQQYVVPPPPLARTSSVLDRLRSLGLYRFRSGDFPPEYAASHAHAQDVSHVVVPPADDDEARQGHYGRSRSEPAPAPAREETRATPSRMKKSSSEVRKAEVVRAPARVVQAAVAEEDDEDVVDGRADGFTDSFAPPQQELHLLHYQEEYVPPPAPAPLARTPSMLDRLRSIGNLYRFRSGDLAPEYAAAPDAATAAADKKQQQQATHTHYDRSRSEPAKKQAAAAATRMSKSSSEARKAAAPTASAVEEEGVDARADDFINRFRQQLHLQRLNSLLNYREMLNRGAKQ